MDAQGHSQSGVSPSPEAWIWDYQSKPHEKTITWLILSRAVATACCWGIVWPKPSSQRHSARAWIKQQHHSCHWGQNIFPSFFFLKWAHATKAGERKTHFCNPTDDNQGIRRSFSDMGNTAGTICWAAWQSQCSLCSTKGEAGVTWRLTCSWPLARTVTHTRTVAPYLR